MATRKGEEITIAGRPLSSYDGMSDEEILEIKGIGIETLKKIRAAEAEEEIRRIQAAEAEEKIRALQAEAEAVRPVEKPCETCGEPFTPAKPEYKHCPKCFRAYRRRGAQEQAEGALKEVHGILQSIIERNPWCDYTEPMDLFERAKAKYAAGDYRTLIGDLYQGVLGKANRITAEGDLRYVGRLIADGLEETAELRELRETAESLFAEKNFQEAAGKAREVKWLAGKLRREQEAVRQAAEREELLASLKFKPQSQRNRSKKG